MSQSDLLPPSTGTVSGTPESARSIPSSSSSASATVTISSASFVFASLSFSASAVSDVLFVSPVFAELEVVDATVEPDVFEELLEELELAVEPELDVVVFAVEEVLELEELLS